MVGRCGRGNLSLSLSLSLFLFRPRLATVTKQVAISDGTRIYTTAQSSFAFALFAAVETAAQATASYLRSSSS